MTAAGRTGDVIPGAAPALSVSATSHAASPECPQGLPQHHGFAAICRARQAVRDARGVLVMAAPDAVAGTVPSLEQAVAGITELADSVRSGEKVPVAETLAALDDIRSELNRIGAVLDYAAAYHTAWARILCSMASGYTAGGTAPLPEPPPRITTTG